MRTIPISAMMVLFLTAGLLAQEQFDRRVAGGELLTGLADGWNRMGNPDKARTYFDRIVTELSGTVYEQRAKAWLENKPEAKSPQFFACTGCHVD